MKDLGLRAATGTIYVLVTLFAAWSGPFTTMMVFFPVCILAADEFHRLYWGGEGQDLRIWIMLLTGTIYLTLALGALLEDWHPGYVLAMVFLLLVITMAWMLMRGSTHPAADLGGAVLVIVLIALPFGLLPHFFSMGRSIFLGMMILLWVNDTGAYLVGRLLGRRKLLSAVSPKKTVEGFVGGLLLAMVVGWLMSTQWPAMTTVQWMTAALLVGLVATVGDLLESAFKRARGVKDSGAVLPGHGGILDRFDGFILAAPAMYLYVTLIG